MSSLLQPQLAAATCDRSHIRKVNNEKKPGSDKKNNFTTLQLKYEKACSSEFYLAK